MQYHLPDYLPRTHALSNHASNKLSTVHHDIAASVTHQAQFQLVEMHHGILYVYICGYEHSLTFLPDRQLQYYYLQLVQHTCEPSEDFISTTKEVSPKSTIL